MASEEVANLFGLTTDELKASLKQGTTLKALAEDKGVDFQKVIDLGVKLMSAHLDQHVTGGKLTQAQADELKAGLTEKVTNLVNHVKVMDKEKVMGKGSMGMKGYNSKPEPAAAESADAAASA